MGVRFRRSIRVGPGVRLNLGLTGVGASFGVRGARYSVHSSGRRTRTVGIPGTGLSYVETRGGAGNARRASARHETSVFAASAPQLLPKPGWLAGTADRRYYEGFQAFLAEDFASALTAFEACLAAEPGAVSAHLFCAICACKTDAPDTVQIAHLEASVQSQDPIPDALQAKYLPLRLVSLQLSVKITENIQAQAPFGSVGATLMLAELYQHTSRLEEAIGLVQQLHGADASDPAIRLSLADLYFADGDHEAVIEAASTANNDSDLGVALLHLRAAAMFSMNLRDGAFNSFKEALAKTAGRDPELLKVVRYDRALAYEAAGQKAKAKADLERIYAADPGYQDVRERLTTVSAAAGD
jgi:tetratricopeptide (TPR) repeat protein